MGVEAELWYVILLQLALMIYLILYDVLATLFWSMIGGKRRFVFFGNDESQVR